MKKSFIVVLVLSLTVFLTSSSAFASNATATAYFDFSTAFNTLKAMGVGFQITSENTYTDAWATNASESSFLTGISTPTHSSGSISNASAEAWTNYNGNDGYLFTTSSAVVQPYPNYPAGYASAQLTGTYTYAGPAQSVTLDIPYSLVYNLASGSGTLSSAYGYATYSYLFDEQRGKGTVTKSDYDFIWTFVNNTQTAIITDQPGNNTGTLHIPIQFNPTEHGTFAFNTATDVSASVPIPAVLWLLGPGLAGLVGIRRKYFSE